MSLMFQNLPRSISHLHLQPFHSRAWLYLAVILALAWSAQGVFAQGGRGGPPPVISPEVGADGKMTFRLRAPNAREVRLSGGDIPGVGNGEMIRGSNDVWEVTLGPVKPGAYRYTFNVDGLAVVDPRNPATSESNANVWSLAVVPGAEFVDERQAPHGVVGEVHYFSKSLNQFRRMHVYTPPGYEKGAAKYPVFYLLHGASDSDDSWTSVGRANFILDNLIAEKKAAPMIVVMPAGHTSRAVFGPRAGGNPPRDEFAEDFNQDIQPYIESHYRVRTDRASRAMAGLSMGGAQTLNIVIPRLGDFGYFGVFSSGVFGITGGRGGSSLSQGPAWIERNKAALENAEARKGLKLAWFGTGRDDFLLETSRATVEMLKKNGFDVVYRETDGAHTWMVWRDYLHEFVPQLFQ